MDPLIPFRTTASESSDSTAVPFGDTPRNYTVASSLPNQSRLGWMLEEPSVIGHANGEVRRMSSVLDMRLGPLTHGTVDKTALLARPRNSRPSYCAERPAPSTDPLVEDSRTPPRRRHHAIPELNPLSAASYCSSQGVRHVVSDSSSSPLRDTASTLRTPHFGLATDTPPTSRTTAKTSSARSSLVGSSCTDLDDTEDSVATCSVSKDRRKQAVDSSAGTTVHATSHAVYDDSVSQVAELAATLLRLDEPDHERSYTAPCRTSPTHDLESRTAASRNTSCTYSQDTAKPLRDRIVVLESSKTRRQRTTSSTSTTHATTSNPEAWKGWAVSSVAKELFGEDPEADTGNAVSESETCTAASPCSHTVPSSLPTSCTPDTQYWQLPQLPLQLASVAPPSPRRNAYSAPCTASEPLDLHTTDAGYATDAENSDDYGDDENVSVEGMEGYDGAVDVFGIPIPPPRQRRTANRLTRTRGGHRVHRLEVEEEPKSLPSFLDPAPGATQVDPEEDPSLHDRACYMPASVVAESPSRIDLSALLC